MGYAFFKVIVFNRGISGENHITHDSVKKNENKQIMPKQLLVPTHSHNALWMTQSSQCLYTFSTQCLYKYLYE